jgi:hypothetical protein
MTAATEKCLKPQDECSYSKPSLAQQRLEPREERSTAKEGSQARMMRIPGPDCGAQDSDIVIQRELIRMRTLADGLHFFRALVIDVGPQQLFRKHIALQQEGVVAFEGI